MSVEVVAFDHVYVAVRDLEISEAFYDPLMRCLGFRKGTMPIGGEPHLHYFNRLALDDFGYNHGLDDSLGGWCCRRRCTGCEDHAGNHEDTKGNE